MSQRKIGFVSNDDFLKSMNISTENTEMFANKPNHLNDVEVNEAAMKMANEHSPNREFKPLPVIGDGKLGGAIEPTGFSEIDAQRAKLAEEAAIKFAGKMGLVHVLGLSIPAICIGVKLLTLKSDLNIHEVKLIVMTEKSGNGECKPEDFEVLGDVELGKE